MAIFSLPWDGTVATVCHGGSVTLGNFDGVHRGHQALVREAALRAHATGGPAVAVTFDPHPLQLLRPTLFQPLLTTPARRSELLHLAGADHVVILATSPALLGLSARNFFDQIIRGRLGARVVVEGPNFGFGKNREGSVQVLQELCREAGLTLKVVEPVAMGGTPISSSRVRRELEKGDVRAATDLLGRPYQVAGRVAHGSHRGQSLGFPTANLEEVSTLLPADGVYAVRVPFFGQTWPAAANIGPNPTFGEKARKLEVHLIGFEGNLYGQVLPVEFIERLRDTKPFSSAEELVQQLRADVEKAQRVTT